MSKLNLNRIWEALASTDPSKCLPTGHAGCTPQCESETIHYVTVTVPKETK